MRKLSSISIRLLGLAVVVALVGVFPLAGTGSTGLSSPPPSGGDVLMLKSIVDAVGEDAVPAATQVNEKAIAEGLGLKVDVVTDQQWATLTAADFAKYKAIVLGDPFCSGDDATILAAPLANTAVWGPVVRGNVFVHTFDAALHSGDDDDAAGTHALMAKGITYAIGAAGKTGLYLSTSCYDGPTVAHVLDGVATGWTFVPDGDWADDVECDLIYFVNPLPAELAGLTAEELSHWGCSTHGFFSTWPTSFTVLGIISNIPEDEVVPPSVDTHQAKTAEGSNQEADDFTFGDLVGSPVILVRPALADPPVIEPTFTG